MRAPTLVVLPLALALTAHASAQPPGPTGGAEETPIGPGDSGGAPAGPPGREHEPTVPRVDVRPGAEDEAISQRLERILKATGWFEDIEVRTREGVVFLRGWAESERRKEWAGELARNTEDVVAVVDQLEIAQAPIWDFGPAIDALRDLMRRVVRALPGFGFALAVLVTTWLLARVARALIERLATRRVRNPLLRRLVARTGAILVLTLGVYIVLYVSGLTRLAVTVLGGTGLVGLVLGIAFKDITENFLASVLLSVQQPFRVDDLVEVAGVTGYVQRTTFRTTILMTLEGNHVQVPNATVFKSSIRNFTSNPRRREDFVVGIGYGVPISRAQEIARDVLRRHPAVLDDPEPWVLVDSLASATVRLRIYFWLDGTKHSWLKVRSSVIRLVKRAFQAAAIPMPDEAREVVFPDGVPVRTFEAEEKTAYAAAEGARVDESPAAATSAEGELESDAGSLKEQARRARAPETGENLLSPGTESP